jgi:hypothetical protein
MLALLASNATSCHFPWSRPRPPQPSAADIERRVYLLMLCQECVGGERRDVVALGTSAVPVLRRMLLTGPPPDHIAQLTQTLTTPPPSPTRPPPSAATIALQIADFGSMYRIRAADALGGIGDAGAKNALCAGRSTAALRPEVYRMIDSALARIGGSACP